MTIDRYPLLRSPRLTVSMSVHGSACPLDGLEAGADAFGLTSFSPFLLLGGEAGSVGRAACIAAEPFSAGLVIDTDGVYASTYVTDGSKMGSLHAGIARR